MKLGRHRVLLIMSLTLLMLYPEQHFCDHKISVCPMTIQHDRLCLKPGAQLNITCRLRCGGETRTNGSMNLENWMLVWYHDGEILATDTASSQGSTGEITSQITVYSTGMFTCVSTNQESPWHSQNRSVNVDKVPKPVKKLKKPVYTAIGENFIDNVVKISWRCFDTAGKHNYTLVLWIKNPDGEQSYSGVISCGSSTCRCLFYVNEVDDDSLDYSNVSFYIVTRSGGCEAKSRVWTFIFSTTRYDAKGNLVIFVPPPADRVYITTAIDKVTLTWDDREARYHYYAGYSYRYNNSIESTRVKKTDILEETTSIVLTNKDIRHYTPFQEYTFCVQFQWYNAGDYSQFRCNTTRLHEDIPSEAPTITCSSDTCATTDNGEKRNVTITWDLSPEETWNGVLTELKVVYYSSRTLVSSEKMEGPVQMEISVGNTSLRSIVVELNSTQRYIVSMQACTKVGCSENGKNLQIVVRAKKVSPSSDISVLIAACFTAVTIIIAIALLSCYVWLWRRRHQCYPSNDGRKALEDVREPYNQYDAAQNEPEIFDKLYTGINQKDINANGTMIVQ